MERVPSRYQFPRAQPPTDLPANTCIRTVSAVGNIGLDSVSYKVGGQHAFRQVLVVSDGDKVIITGLDGEVLAERTRPAPGITYVGNGRPRGLQPQRR